jgi:hypothetical protein
MFLDINNTKQNGLFGEDLIKILLWWWKTSTYLLPLLSV